MNDQEKAELRRLAEAAAHKDWYAGNAYDKPFILNSQIITDTPDGKYVLLDGNHHFRADCVANVAFVGAASPAVVLSLLDQCDGLMAQHARDSATLRELCQARDDAKKERDVALAEREELRRLLDCFVKGESDPDENQSERHMYVTEAQSLLAHMDGKIKAHTLVPDEVLRNQSAELEAYKRQLQALINISDATGWERHTCGEIAKARKLIGLAEKP